MPQLAITIRKASVADIPVILRYRRGMYVDMGYTQLLQGWQVTTAATFEGGEPYTLGDFTSDTSVTGELNDRWNISGDPHRIHWTRPGSSIPYFCNPDTAVSCSESVDTTPPECRAQAGTADLQTSLDLFGCYVQNGVVITPPALGTFGNMGRNSFRGPTFKNVDFSISKVWNLNERMKMQFRGEFFNLLNHPNFDVFTLNTDLGTGRVGEAVATPDVGNANPVIGSGGSRHIQLGVKIIW